MTSNRIKGVKLRTPLTSKKRFRVLYLTWHLRQGLRKEECRVMLFDMGLDDGGRPKRFDPKTAQL